VYAHQEAENGDKPKRAHVWQVTVHVSKYPVKTDE